MNARHRFWNCNRANGAGNILFDSMQRGCFSIYHPNAPTYYPSYAHRTTSTLDIILSNNMHELSDPFTLTELTSDHLPVFCKILSTKPTRLSKKRIFNYAEANWHIFKQNIEQNSTIPRDSISNENQIDEMISKFNAAITNAHNQAIPTVIHDQYEIIIPQDVLNLIKVRNAYRRKWQRQRNNKALESIYKYLSVTIKQRLDFVRNNAWSKNLWSISQDQPNKNKLWKLIRIIKNKQKFIPPLKENDTLLISPVEKCEML